MALQKDINHFCDQRGWKKWKSNLTGGQKTYHVGKRKDRLL